MATITADILGAIAQEKLPSAMAVMKERAKGSCPAQAPEGHKASVDKKSAPQEFPIGETPVCHSSRSVELF